MRVQKLTISHCILSHDIKIKKYLTSKSSLLALVATDDDDDDDDDDDVQWFNVHLKAD